MTPKEILDLTAPPTKSRAQYGEVLYELVTKQRLSSVLDLRSVPDIVTVYLAGAIQSLGGGLLTSVYQNPSQLSGYDVQRALQMTGLTSFAVFCKEPYSWLTKVLQEKHSEQYDLCVIDGSQVWSEVGFACGLVERLLKPSGWILLDNFNNDFLDSSTKNYLPGKSELEGEERIHQVKSAFELLVQGSPNFGMFRKRGPLTWAQKKGSVWSLESRLRNRIETIICNAIDRARRDPDFRRELLDNPQVALSLLVENVPKELGCLRFIDSDELVPLTVEEPQSGNPIVHLDRAAWHKSISEDALEEMLRK